MKLCGKMTEGGGKIYFNFMKAKRRNGSILAGASRTIIYTTYVLFVFVFLFSPATYRRLSLSFSSDLWVSLRIYSPCKDGRLE